ncbi:MAG: diguanylate cyclase [Thermoanaerobaculales bacterium]|nr:diguanylate cyclase [Thermoanaerobaculales bacterium]
MRWILFFLFPVALIGTAEAQWKPVRHFTVRDGLIQSQISDLTQDADGYLWIGTQAGLCRFDGNNFRNFTADEGLPDTVVPSLTARDGTVWIATERGGLVRWDGHELHAVASSLFNDETSITGIRFLGDGTTVVGSTDGLVAGGPGAWRRISEKPVSWLKAGPDGSVLALGKHPLIVDADLEVHEISGLSEEQSLGDITFLGEDTWMAVEPRSLARVTGGQVEWATLDVPGRITAILGSHDGLSLWIGTDQSLWRLQSDGELECFPLLPSGERVQVSTLMEDREGSLWIGSWGSGLFQIPPTQWTHFNLTTGLPSQSVWSFSEDPDGCIWMATIDAGVISWCDDHWGRTLDSEDGLPSSTVFSVAHDADGALWIGTSKGVCRSFDEEFRCWTKEDGLPDDFVLQLKPSRSGGMWMATDKGLGLWDGERWSFWGPEEGLPGPSVRALAEDATGRLWMAINSVGVVSFDGTKFSTLDGIPGFPGNRVWTLVISSREELLVGTDLGIWIKPVEGDDPGVFVGTEDGLPYPAVVFAVEDLEQRIWAGTTHGVAVLSPEGEVLQKFNAANGLSDSEASEGAAMRDSSGRLWLGMAFGVTVIDPSRLQRDTIPPEVVLEKALANGKPLEGFAAASTVGGNPPQILRIDPSITHLRFEYSAPSYIAPDLIRFRLALTCYGDEFSRPSTERYVTFHLLPPGRYRFGIVAETIDGTQSTHPLWFELDVWPPWYRSGWFQLSLILAAALFGAGVLQLRQRGQRKRNAWLETEVQQRTKDLDAAHERISEQNRQLTELSRTDPLTGLGNRRVMAEALPLELSLLHREVQREIPEDMAQYRGGVVVMLDLDRFKVVNDRWGHEVGDEALRACAKIFESELREGDQAVRWGGDEFIVLSRSLQREGAIGFAGRLLKHFSEWSMPVPDGSTVGIGASIGFVQIPLGVSGLVPSNQWQRFIDIADQLLYLAKERGRGGAYGLVWKVGSQEVQSESQTVELLSRDPLHPPPGIELIHIESSPD